jgi:hypothetical protein
MQGVSEIGGKLQKVLQILWNLPFFDDLPQAAGTLIGRIKSPGNLGAVRDEPENGNGHGRQRARDQAETGTGGQAMALNFIENQTNNELTPRITVFGVGGAGGNAVNNMIDKNLEGVEFVVANTDAQALQQSKSRARAHPAGRASVTEGLGAGARPRSARSAAEETLEEIVDHLAGAHMCFITAGMGGGTGTGAAPIIAQAARELGVLTVGVVTKPFPSRAPSGCARPRTGSRRCRRWSTP